MARRQPQLAHYKVFVSRDPHSLHTENLRQLAHNRGSRARLYVCGQPIVTREAAGGNALVDRRGPWLEKPRSSIPLPCSGSASRGPCRPVLSPCKVPLSSTSGLETSRTPISIDPAVSSVVVRSSPVLSFPTPFRQFRRRADSGYHRLGPATGSWRRCIAQSLPLGLWRSGSTCQPQSLS